MGGDPLEKDDGWRPMWRRRTWLRSSEKEDSLEEEEEKEEATTLAAWLKMLGPSAWEARWQGNRRRRRRRRKEKRRHGRGRLLKGLAMTDSHGGCGRLCVGAHVYLSTISLSVCFLLCPLVHHAFCKEL